MHNEAERLAVQVVNNQAALRRLDPVTRRNLIDDITALLETIRPDLTFRTLPILTPDDPHSKACWPLTDDGTVIRAVYEIDLRTGEYTAHGTELNAPIKPVDGVVPSYKGKAAALQFNDIYWKIPALEEYGLVFDPKAATYYKQFP